MTKLSILKYKYFAYMNVRDAIGFYLGIPIFLKTINQEELIEERLKQKLAKNPNYSEADILKYKKLITKSLQNRIKNLEDDYEYCKTVLFTDSLWLQWLDLDSNFFKTYLDRLPEHIVAKLAVIPSWTIRDDDLSRPYLNSDRNVKYLYA